MVDPVHAQISVGNQVMPLASGANVEPAELSIRETTLHGQVAPYPLSSKLMRESK